VAKGAVAAAALAAALAAAAAAAYFAWRYRREIYRLLSVVVEPIARWGFADLPRQPTTKAQRAASQDFETCWSQAKKEERQREHRHHNRRQENGAARRRNSNVREYFRTEVSDDEMSYCPSD
jgi:CelD/BcsL family acetyltransferase involved in cellulose biosynthesis